VVYVNIVCYVSGSERERLNRNWWKCLIKRVEEDGMEEETGETRVE
jgi:hypothetical protein